MRNAIVWLGVGFEYTLRTETLFVAHNETTSQRTEHLVVFMCGVRAHTALNDASGIDHGACQIHPHAHAC